MTPAYCHLYRMVYLLTGISGILDKEGCFFMEKNCTKCVLRSNQHVTSEEMSLMARYVPYRVVKAMGESPCCFFEKRIERLEGVVVYLDIIGFTPIVAEYMKTKKDVADLSGTLSDYYSVIIETIREFGGSVFQFAGDSILIAFEKLPGESDEDDLRRALAAMILALDLSDNYNAVSEKYVSFTLRPKIGIGQGEFFQIMLGDRERFMTPVITGAAVIQAVQMEEVCDKQEIVLSFPAWMCACKVGLENSFAEEEGFFHLTSAPDNFANTVNRPDYFDEEELFQNPRFYNRLYSFINPIILHQIRNSFRGFDGDYRTVTCCMVRFDGVFTKIINKESVSQGYGNLNSIYNLIQEKASRYGTFCGKPDLSDKGIVFPVLFGVPSAIENKEATAVIFANEILKAEKTAGSAAAVNIGIASGAVYAGEFGANTAKDFTVVGSTINFAARLMMNASNHGRFTIFMDEETKRKAETVCDTEVKPGITLKGYEGEQTVYQFKMLRRESEKGFHKAGLFGRKKELGMLAAQFEKTCSGHVCVAPVMGEAGIGKSYLVEQFVADTMKRCPDTDAVYGFCYQYEESTLLYCWREVIGRIIGMQDDLSGEEMSQFTEKVFLRIFPEETAWITFFLNNIFGTNFPESPSVAEMDPQLKMTHLFDLVYRLFADYTKKGPLIIILEDIHWGDTVSLRLLEYMMTCSGHAPVLIIPISRESDAIRQFFLSHGLSVMKLGPIDEASASKLTEKLLLLDVPETQLVERIVKTAGGSPFFIENIVQNLIESGVIARNDTGVFYLAKNVKSISIPSSIQNLILSRVNALPYEEQVVCKTASVIGRVFTSDVLESLVPESLTKYTVEQALTDLAAHGIISADGNDSRSYTFKDITICDVVYDTVLETTRREINKSILLYLERKNSDNLSAVSERLEYYAIEAKDYDKVLEYALVSAQKADRQGAVQDAVMHYNTALSASENTEIQITPEKMNAIHLALADEYRKKGEYDKALDEFGIVISQEKNPLLLAPALQGQGRCYQEQGRFPDAVSSLEKAMSALGRHVPSARIVLVGAVFREALHIIHRDFPEGLHAVQYKGAERRKTEISVDILSVLNKLYYFSQFEKLAWCSIVNFRNVMHISDCTDKAVVAIGDYAVALCGAGYLKSSRKLFKYEGKRAAESGNLRSISIFKARHGYYYMFTGDMKKSISHLEIAASNFPALGEQWEYMTAESALGEDYFFTGNFVKAQHAFEEAEHQARLLHSPMHIGWAYNKIPFIKYLQGKVTAEEAVIQISQGIEMSRNANDSMEMCIHYGLLSYIAMKERRPLQALEYAEEVIKANKSYKTGVPHIKMSYVYAVEAMCYAFEQQVIPVVKRSKYMSIARHALSQALKSGKKYPMVRGPAERAAARFALVRGQKRAAGILCHSSIEVLSVEPYSWECAKSLILASKCGIDEHGSYRKRAEIIMATLGLQTV